MILRMFYKIATCSPFWVLWLWSLSSLPQSRNRLPVIIKILLHWILWTFWPYFCRLYLVICDYNNSIFNVESINIQNNNKVILFPVIESRVLYYSIIGQNFRLSWPDHLDNQTKCPVIKTVWLSKRLVTERSFQLFPLTERSVIRVWLYTLAPRLAYRWLQ